MKSDLLKQYLPIIKKHIDYIDETNMAYYDNGHDHFVFVVNGKHAFRFPISSEHGKQDTVINAFSEEFVSLSPIPVQQMTGHVDSQTGIRYQTYTFIPGIPLTTEIVKTLTEGEVTHIAKDMGKFLSTLHNFPVVNAREMGMESLISPQDYAEYFVSVIDLDKEYIFDLLTQEEWNWFVANVQTFKDISYKHPYEFTVTHSDMLPEHILIDEKTHKLSGIIDFSLRIADPANDFKYFDRYGELFLKTVYKHYHPVDSVFDKRRKFYAADLPVANLYQSVERGDDKKIQQLFIHELKDYYRFQNQTF